MRINQFVAKATGLSRRAADAAVSEKRVLVNGEIAELGLDIFGNERVELDNRQINIPTKVTTIILHKPTGYVVSRDGQGSPTVYELLPENFGHLKSVGRLDKDSSGILLLTDDGQLANDLTHPKFVKDKIYRVHLNKDLSTGDREKIEKGVSLDDGISKLNLHGAEKDWQVTMHEGRNRQIRRTFEALGYRIVSLHRVSFGSYQLGELKIGNWRFSQKSDII